MAFTSGIQNPYTVNGITVTPVYAFAAEWFLNRTPLITRLGPKAEGADRFKITNDRFRPSTNQLAEALDGSETDVDVDDASMFQSGDIIEVDSETMLITAVSASPSNTLTVTRGYAGTSATSHNDDSIVYVIGNSRTGGEVDVDGISYTPTAVDQHLQTFQHPYQIGGSLATNTAVALPAGIPNWVKREQLAAMERVMEDAERTYYYGRGVARNGTSTRPAMYGLRSLLTSNNTVSPVNAAAYKPEDLIRDTVQKCLDGGGDPDILLVSTDFLTGFATWGHAAMRIDAGETEFGTPIRVLEVPFLSGMSIVPAPLLRTGSVFCLTSREITQRIKRAIHDKPRGSRGDAVEGDIIAEQAIEVENEAHHAYVTGITAFSAA